jgi:hypothetical protein
MPTATTNLHWWFYTLFAESYESLGEDENNVKKEMRQILGIGEMIGFFGLRLRKWCDERLRDGDTIVGSFKEAVMNTVDWVKLRDDLAQWFRDNYDEEEEEEETCVSCEETKTDEFYYNLTPKKNAPVCTACRDREETCRCCDIKYPYYQIKHDGGGKYLCITCDNEYPDGHDLKTASTCPALLKIIDTLASNSSSSSS